MGSLLSALDLESSHPELATGVSFVRAGAQIAAFDLRPR